MSTSPNETTAATATSPLLPHQKLEAHCEEQHIYPLYRVLEDEYTHQYGDLPETYRQEKVKLDGLDGKVRKQLREEIKRGLECAAEAEHHQQQRHGGPQQAFSPPQVSEAELEQLVMREIEKSYEQTGGSRPTRYVVLLNEKFTAELYRHIHALPDKRTALCFSGGGIRSASFGLGIVQGLARYGLLEKFDYLSTVSGGGYLGSWLSAWIHRSRLADVITALKNEPEKNKLQPEPDPIRHLRSYSNYLNPKLGFLSADTWTLVAIVVRNLLLNWLVLIPVILAALMLPRIVVAIVHTNMATGRRVLAWEFWLGTLFGLIAIVYMGVARPSASRPRKINKQKWNQQGAFLAVCLLPLSLSAVLLTSWWAWRRNAGGELFPAAWPRFLLYGIALHVAAYIIYTLILIYKDVKFWRERGARNWRLYLEPFAVVLVGALWGLLVWWAANRLFPTPSSASPAPVPWTELYASFAAPLFVLIFLLAVIIFVGVASNITDDDDREWWARFGAWVLIVAVLWSGLSALVIFGPVGVMWAGGKFQVILAALGGASGLLTILGGKSQKTSSHAEQEGQKSSGLADYATVLAAPLFALTLLIFFSLATSALIRLVSPAGFDWRDAGQSAYSVNGVLNTVHYAPLGLLLLVAFGLFALSLIMSTRVNVNKFSLHAMYRNRLIRAYMGASRPQSERRPNPFTGFDIYDNIAMHELSHLPGALDDPKARKTKLLHVVNICLNLTRGHNLAWQQRKAETFTVSPLHCGSFQLGYRKTKEYGGKGAPPGDGISLGTAVTISGAAASPNMGYHSSPALAFLMTLFNARLGWWLGNPGPAGNDKYSERFHTYNRSGPIFALRPILSEALGHTDNTSPYVYLSDGGHFENLGIYEMVLRRAHLIVVSDGSQDPQSRFEDLAGAVRKIRIDLGIPIDFIGGIPIYGKNDKEHKDKTKYCAVGLIRYSCADTDTSGKAAKDGVIIYIKPAIMGGEPIDVLNYAATSPFFPHESTADQNYSEQQLESYRALGSHVIQTICGESPPDLPLMADNADNFIQRAYDQVPDAMKPPKLKGRFNIPIVAAGSVKDEKDEAEKASPEAADKEVADREAADKGAADSGTDQQSQPATQDISCVVVARPKSKYRFRFYVQKRKQ